MKEIEKDFIEFCNKRKCTDCKFEEKQYSNDCLALFSYDKGRADAIEEVKHQMISFHTDAIFRYGVDIIEAKCDAFDELETWLKEQK